MERDNQRTRADLSFPICLFKTSMPPSPQGRDIWMFEKRCSVKQKASAKLATERRYHVKARSAKVKKKLCTLLDLCVSSLRRGHANLLCIVPILTDDPRRESEVIQLKSLSDCTDKLRSALHAYSRGFRGLSPKKILAPNSRNF